MDVLQSLWKLHKKSKDHIHKANEQRKLKQNEKTSCKICEIEFLRKDIKEHQNTLAHIEAQKIHYGEIQCYICKEKYAKGYRRQHIKTKNHILRSEYLKEIRKVGRKRKATAITRTRYEIQEPSDENQLYLDTLTTFFSLRLALEITTDFKVSINNETWEDFGDIVFEIMNRTVAIQCKKIESRKNYNIVALRAESGHLSVFKQCESVSKLKSRYENATFKLVTVSNITIDVPKFDYSKDLIWAGKEIEILQPQNKKKDFFNTTNDNEDVCFFKFTKGADEALINDLSKLKLYFNQKNRLELKSSIKSLVVKHFGSDFDISEELIKYVRLFFGSDKTFKLDSFSYFMTRTDILLKTVELLLTPFCVFPDSLFKEKEMNLWDSVTKEFDIILLKHNSGIIEKIYKVINQVLKSEIVFSLDSYNKVVVDLGLIENEKLKSNLYNHGGTLKCIYLALWKSELIPLILKIDSKKYFDFVLNIIQFCDRHNFNLKFILTINEMLDSPSLHFSDDLKVFRNFSDLKMCNGDIWSKVVDTKVTIFTEEVCLSEIFGKNEQLLEQFSADILLNILFDDFSFQDFNVPITTEFYENSIVLDEDIYQRVSVHKDESFEEKFRYLLAIHGVPTVVEVPPKL